MLTGCLAFGRRGRRERPRPAAVRRRAWADASVRGRQVAQRKLDLTVGKLPPVLDDRRIISLRRLIEDLAGFAAGCIDGQLEYLWLYAGYSGCQITGAERHGGPPEDPLGGGIMPPMPAPRRETRQWGRVPWVYPR